MSLRYSLKSALLLSVAPLLRGQEPPKERWLEPLSFPITCKPIEAATELSAVGGFIIEELGAASPVGGREFSVQYDSAGKAIGLTVQWVEQVNPRIRHVFGIVAAFRPTPEGYKFLSTAAADTARIGSVTKEPLTQRALEQASLLAGRLLRYKCGPKLGGAGDRKGL